MAETFVPAGFEIDSGGVALRGESAGEGRDVFLCHGLTASRNRVLHGSRTLPRAGFRVHLFDARGHGSSGAAPPGEGYGYEWQVADLTSVVLAEAGSGKVVVGGHSMGCHTATAWALAHPERVTALIAIGPVHPVSTGSLTAERWDARADALERGGPRAFADLIASEYEGPEGFRPTVHRLALERATEHDDPEEVARALREVPRSVPFESLSELSGITAPVLVVGSRDEVDPGHPLATAEAWAAALPSASLIVEEQGDSPLAWQGGQLSREIARFLEGIGEEGEA